MAIGANVHHSVYLQNVSFLNTRHLLIHDLKKPSYEAAEEFLCLDFNTEPASLNMRPETS